MQFEFLAQIGAGWGPLGTDIRDLTLVETQAGPVVVATTGPSGGILSLSVDAGQVQLLDSINFTAGIAASVTGTMALLTEGGQTFAVVSSSGQGAAVGYALDADGGLNTAATLELDLFIGDSGPVIATSAGSYVYTMSGAGRVEGYAFGAGGYATVGSASDTPTIALEDPVALLTTEVAGTEFLVALSEGDVGLTVMQISGSGALSVTGTIGVGTGLGLLGNPTQMHVTEIGGVTYIVVASAADNGAGGALTVMELSGTGQLIVTDHVLDSLDTRFGTVTAMDTVSVGDWTYVIAGGGDAGLSLFVIAPGGRLLHMDTIVDTQAYGLETISAVSLVVDGDTLTVLAASQDTSGLALLSIDISDQGLALNGAGGAQAGQSRNDVIVGGFGAEELYGHGGNDTLLDGYGEDSLWGGNGADVFQLEADGARDEIHDFQPGVDQIDLSLVPFLYDASRVTIIERPWGAELRFPSGETTIIRSMNGDTLTREQILEAINWSVDRPAMSLINQLIGNEAINALVGSSGTDIIQGLGNNDTLEGMGGNDQLDGGSGRDTLIGGDGDDTLFGGLGRDISDGGNGNDTIIERAQGGTLGRDTIFGGDGDDSIWAGGGWDEVHGDDGDDYAYAGWGNDTMTGGLGNDTLIGVGGFDHLEGGAGQDELSGGNGNDYLDGGSGNDSLRGGSNADYILGGTGNDTIDGQHGLDTIFGGAGDDLIYGGLFRDRLLGDEGDDTMFGGNDDDRMQGDDGNDVMDGGRNNDRMSGGNGTDTLTGAHGNDTLQGNFGNDVLRGEIGNDLLEGGFGSDLLVGGIGNDTLIGGRGEDMLTGGSGADVFIFNSTSGQDTVSDFAAGSDVIELDADVSRFSRLDIDSTSQGQLVSWDGGSVLLLDVGVGVLDADDFVFV
ncbi:hypothetical protein [Tateyamaria sp. SN6-1]|uniref:hypothetical protein n=1 Tax=Tateyamaria sp. SN6-1 TaxID=3092148 RepID=UPI0039F5749D